MAGENVKVEDESKKIDVIAKELAEILSSSKTPEEKREDIKEYLKEFSSERNSRQDLIDLYLAKKITKVFDEDEDKKNDIPLDKILTLGIVQNLLRPQQQQTIDPTLLLAIVKGSGSELEKILPVLIQQQAQAQQQALQYNQQLMTLLLGEKTKSQEEKYTSLAKALEEKFKQIDEKISSLSTQAQQNPSIESELEDWIRKKQVLEGIADVIKPGKVVTEEGKINWGGVLDKLLNIASEVVKRPPAMQPVQLPPQGKVVEVAQTPAETTPVEIAPTQPAQPTEAPQPAEVQPTAEAPAQAPTEAQAPAPEEGIPAEVQPLETQPTEAPTPKEKKIEFR
jgi:hypothetical protein